MSVTLMDCTLRDGGNVVGKGFNAEITEIVLDGLTACHVPIIELGNAGGIGAYEVAGFTKAETDATYLTIAQKYMSRGSKLGMFLNANRYRKESVETAIQGGQAQTSYKYLNIATGLEYSNGEKDMFKSVLEMFCNIKDEKKRKIQKAFESGDWKNYTIFIKLNPLKSNTLIKSNKNIYLINIGINII